MALAKEAGFGSSFELHCSCGCGQLKGLLKKKMLIVDRKKGSANSIKNQILAMLDPNLVVPIAAAAVDRQIIEVSNGIPE